MYKKTRVILDWAIAISIYLCVLLIIPVSTKVFSNLSQDTIDFRLNVLINILVGLVFTCLLIFLVTKGSRGSVFSYLWLLVFLIISIYFLMRVEITRDRLHFLGYAILSLFLYRALRHNIGTQALYIWSGILIMLFAVFDEVLQLSRLGGRTFEFKDIGIDWLSGLVGQCVIAMVIRPKLEAIEIKVRGYTNELRKLKVFGQKRKVKFNGR